MPFYPREPGVQEIMTAENQRDQALAMLDARLARLSALYKECYLSSGRGAIVVYARNVIEKNWPNKNDYRTKDDILDVFDTPSAIAQLSRMIDNYNQRTEGIMALITDYSNATYFITVKLP
jgi:hypothetical protein